MKSHSEMYSCNYEKLLTVEIHNHILRYLAVIMRTSHNCEIWNEITFWDI